MGKERHNDGNRWRSLTKIFCIQQQYLIFKILYLVDLQFILRDHNIHTFFCINWMWNFPFFMYAMKNVGELKSLKDWK